MGQATQRSRKVVADARAVAKAPAIQVRQALIQGLRSGDFTKPTRRECSSAGAIRRVGQAEALESPRELETYLSTKPFCSVSTDYAVAGPVQNPRETLRAPART
jgi:hypothetical protein